MVGLIRTTFWRFPSSELAQHPCNLEIRVTNKILYSSSKEICRKIMTFKNSEISPSPDQSIFWSKFDPMSRSNPSRENSVYESTFNRRSLHSRKRSAIWSGSDSASRWLLSTKASGFYIFSMCWVISGNPLYFGELASRFLCNRIFVSYTKI